MTRYRRIITALYESIRAIVPVYNADKPFVSAEDGTGGSENPTDWMMNPLRRTRDFDIRSTGYTRNGPGCDVISECSIRVAYEMTTDLGLLDEIINEDVLQIINAVGYDTTYWGAIADTVFCPADESPSSEVVNDSSGTPSTIVVSIPVELWYRRVG